MAGQKVAEVGGRLPSTVVSDRRIALFPEQSQISAHRFRITCPDGFNQKL